MRPWWGRFYVPSTRNPLAFPNLCLHITYLLIRFYVQFFRRGRECNKELTDAILELCPDGKRFHPCSRLNSSQPHRVTACRLHRCSKLSLLSINLESFFLQFLFILESAIPSKFWIFGFSRKKIIAVESVRFDCSIYRNCFQFELSVY